jgi:PAS domain S-box-containing protein
MYQETPEQLAHFFALSLDLFCVAGTDGYFKILNPAWKRTLGYSLDELLAQPYINFVHPDDVGATVEVQESLDDGNAVLNFENRYHAKDGSWKWLSWKASPQPDGSIFAVARDITVQKLEEKATQELLRRLEQSNQELDQFAFIVSHDLKAPLRSIINLSEWIKEDLGEDLNPDVAAQIGMLQGRVGRMQQLIEDLLEYAKTGRDDKPLEEIDLNLLIDEIRAGASKPSTFSILVPQALKPIMGRASEVFQLFQNLICNAVKYRSQDAGMVEIRQHPDRGFWRFDITDDGIGIDPRHHKRVFQVFQRLSADDEIEGTGIGLALVKKIVECSGGKISLRSVEGQGSTFTFTWPR